MYKSCSKCGIEKPLSEFYQQRKAKDGKRPDCKECRSKVHKKRYYAKQKEILTSIKVPEVRARRAEAAKRWRARNPEKVRKNNQIQYEKNREEMLAYQSAWRRANKSRVNEYKANRRAKQLQATPSWADREAIQAVFDSCPEGYHVDHIIPLQGENVCGLHIAENLKPIPAKENLSKSNKFRQTELENDG